MGQEMEKITGNKSGDPPQRGEGVGRASGRGGELVSHTPLGAGKHSLQLEWELTTKTWIQSPPSRTLRIRIFCVLRRSRTRRTEGQAVAEAFLPSPSRNPASLAQSKAGLGSNSSKKDTVNQLKKGFSENQPYISVFLKYESNYREKHCGTKKGSYVIFRQVSQDVSTGNQPPTDVCMSVISAVLAMFPF